MRVEPRSRGKGLLRSLTWLFLVSFALRLVCCLAVLRWDVPLLFDERDYFARAVGWQEIQQALIGFDVLSPASLDRAYGKGFWPPFHPLVLGAGLTLGGSGVAAARLLTVLVSSLTTLLVYRYARELVGDGAARGAAWLHAGYPTFIAFSHYLWSETLYVFLLLLGLLAALRLPDTPEDRARLLRAIVAGLALGLAVLTRTSALPFLLAVPAWLAWRSRRLTTPALVLGVGLAVILPWQATLSHREGRFVLLSTLGGYNLALGNHPEVPAGLGSSWGHEPSKARLRAALDATAGERDGDWRAAGLAVALEEVRQRPGAAVWRAVLRLRMLWAPDLFPLRHLFHGVYPPISTPLAAAAALASLAVYLALLTLSVLGLLHRRSRLRKKGLLSILLLAGMLPPLLSIGVPRLHLPLLVLLLPVAVAGLRLIGSGADRRTRALAAGIAAALLLMIGGSLRHAVSTYLLPSSHYAPVIQDADRLLGSRSRFSDRLLLRRTDGSEGELTVKSLTAGVGFADGSRQIRWPADQAELSLDLFADGAAPIELEIASAAGSVRLSPIEPEGWRRWRPTGLPGVEVYWAGGGAVPRSRLEQ